MFLGFVHLSQWMRCLRTDVYRADDGGSTNNYTILQQGPSGVIKFLTVITKVKISSLKSTITLKYFRFFVISYKT